MNLLRIRSLVALGTLAACTASTHDDESAGTDEAAIESVEAHLGEKLEPSEAVLVRQIADAATTQVVQSMSASADHVARRDAHPKAHGCVTGAFTVDTTLPAALRVGTFAPGARYDAWVRFSNGSNADDRANDARGMAIKLLGVPGARLLAGEEATAHTHDLVLSNHHTFFISNLPDYVDFMKTVTEKGNPLSFFISWNIFDLHLREAWLARQFTTQPISSPLTSRYWSVTPYALGRSEVVKYTAIPCGGADTSGDHADDKDYLGKALQKGLSNGGACFDFLVQRRTDPDAMKVEDSTITWDEEEAPFVHVAKLTIPPQAFDSERQKAFCENLSFTPWHGTTEHRPLGSLNRTRKVVYEATSAARHRLNAAPRREPVDLRVP